MSTMTRPPLALTDEQAQAWADRVEGHVRMDCRGRAPRYWAVFLGLAGANLDRVLLELGEAPAPPIPAVLRPRRAFFVRRLFQALAVALALAGPAAAQDAATPAPAPSPTPAPCDPASGPCLGIEGWLLAVHTWAPGVEARSLVGGRLQAEVRWRRWRWAARGDATGVPGEYEPGKLETVRDAEAHFATAYDALTLPGVATIGPAIAVGGAVALEQNADGITAKLPNTLTAGLGLRASWPRGWLYAVAGLNQSLKGFSVTGTWQIAVSARVASIGTVAVGASDSWLATTGIGVRFK